VGQVADLSDSEAGQVSDLSHGARHLLAVLRGSAMRLSLIPLDGGEPYVVVLPLTLVGSKEGCDFRVQGEEVAPVCCVLALSDGLLLLRDLETDSLRVNGQRVRRAILLPNDRLTIGNREFRVCSEQNG
jgi:hypothetical protein